jgi:hypothetical protein
MNKENPPEPLSDLDVVLREIHTVRDELDKAKANQDDPGIDRLTRALADLERQHDELKKS